MSVHAPRGRPARATRALALAALVVLACGRGEGARGPAGAGVPAGPVLFERLAAAQTGVAFQNTLPEAPDFNIINYLYYYNGGGVAVGDVNGDGLQDLYFSSNLGPNRLYLNKGNFAFEDVTDRAGVAGPEGWKTGVTMADVTGDGKVDLYVSAVNYLTMHGHNVLYVNNGDGTFTDRTEATGLAQQGYATQATFFDYDNDGDLDAYLLNHSTHVERGIDPIQRGFRESPAADRLLRNDGGHFTDVTRAAGIVDGVGGFGLGVVASDLDGDGCTDLYVANDFQENDFLYHNTCHGTFTESIASATGHTSRFSMGVDAADLDDDGRPELFVADMLPEREDVLKTSASSETPSLFDLRLRAGYHPQYPRNTLQLNRGGLRFSEVGYLSGTFASDWSWAPLFADLDNDGRKDLFVTNGIYRRPNDMDYISYLGNEAVQASLAQGITKENLAILQKLPSVPLANHAFRNEGGLRFTDMAKAWGLAEVPGFSNGAAYVDLDNDGALDLVVNQVNAPAGIYRNRARERNGNGALTIRLHGAKANVDGVGARVFVTANGATQLVEQSPTRGFESSVDPRLHVGLARAAQVDSLLVVWPDRRFQVVRGVAANTTLTLWQDSASGRWAPPAVPGTREPAPDLAPALHANVSHLENDFLDYNREPLMTGRLSTEGPALAVGDVNGDGLDDLFIGGAKWQAGRILVQAKAGGFTTMPQPALQADSLAEDVDATFVDVDGDRDLDLVVVSGGNEFSGESEALLNRLYRNDGQGHFTRDAAALPVANENGGCVAAGDFDGDGDVDLFFGSRVVAREYGRIPTSHLLRNEGNGRYTDVTAELAPQLAKVGMVSDAAWMDTNGDRALDLVVVGEWMPVTVFRQEGGHLVNRTTEAGLAGSSGWWNSVTVADLDKDGKQDLVLGNLGLNSYVKATADEPARLYVHDFYKTGATKAVLTFYKQGVSYPLAGRDDFQKLMPPLRAKFPSYHAYGAARMQDIFLPDELKAAEVREARTFASAVARQGADGRFTLVPLPVEAQLAPVYAALVDDLDGDGVADAFVAGNFTGVIPVIGRYDASRGTLLHGAGDGTFAARDDARSGLVVDGEVRDLAVVRQAGGRRLLAVARNNATLQLFPLPPAGGSAPHD